MTHYKLIVVLGVLQWAMNASAHCAEFKDLELRIAVDAKNAVQFIPVELEVFLTNGTDEAAKGNRQLSHEQFLTIYITKPDGTRQRLDYSPRRIGLRPGPLPEVIQVGEVVSHRVLIPYNEIESPGEYRFSAHLQDWDRKTVIHAEAISLVIAPSPDSESRAIALLRDHNLLSLLSIDAMPVESEADVLKHLEQFVSAGFDRSIFLPYVKAKLGALLVNKHIARPISDEGLMRGVSLLEQAANTDGYGQAQSALLRAGIVYKRKHDDVRAKATFATVISRWPDSESAVQAKLNIEAIDRRASIKRRDSNVVPE